ncbi:MAG: ribonuclease Z [Thermoplasmata archaeon]
MKLVFLGTGGSWPSKDRNVTSIALQHNGEVILMDCGEGTQRQLMRSSISFMQIEKILITHLHGDHFLGLPGLVQSMGLNNRERPLEILCPKGAKEILNIFLSVGYFTRDFEINIREVSDGECIDFEKYLIKAVSSDHLVPTLAYRFEEPPRKGMFDLEKAKRLGIPPGKLYSRLQNGETIEYKGTKITPEMVIGPKRKGRSIVYSGDTRPCERIVELAKECNVLIHEGLVDDNLREKANEYGHSTITQAAEVAYRANVGKLFIVHISPRYKLEDNPSLEEKARKVFPNTIVATDLMEYEVKYKE